jgi:hypothetical protein
MEEMGIPDDDAATYAAGLAEQSYVQAEQVLSLSAKELVQDFRFKKGHALKISTPCGPVAPDASRIM